MSWRLQENIKDGASFSGSGEERTSNKKQREMTDKFTSPEFLPYFIEMYRDLPCLWKIKSKEYADKYKRHEAYSKLAELCKSVNAKADVLYVKSKIANLRTTFKKELNKIHASLKSGAEPDEVYVPRLWYFESLRFLADQNEARSSVSSLPPNSSESMSPEMDLDSKEEKPDTQELIISDAHIAAAAVAAEPPQRGNKRKNIEDATINFLAQATAALQRETDDCDAFGSLSAHRLRRMTEEQKLLVEPLLLQLLAKGLRGEITSNTCIAEYSSTNGPSLHQAGQKPPNWHVSVSTPECHNTSWS